MGLKKDPEAVQGEAGQVEEPQAPPTAPTTPAAVTAPAPAKAPQAKPQPKAEAPKQETKKGKQVTVLAVRRPLADPFTGVLYTENIPKPGDRYPGNWIDCQMKAGLLAEYTGPAPEGSE